MGADPEDFERLAEECERVATKIGDGKLAFAFLEMAVGCRELADRCRTAIKKATKGS